MATGKTSRSYPIKHLTCDKALALEPKPESGRSTGLALSGGGIRSATFNLGVLEYLHETGILKNLNYLSTVSGGGYIGAWLSANARRNSAFLDPATSWEKPISHLRRYSNYLSPKVGFLSADTWTMGMVWFRNALLMQITVFLAISAALLIPRLIEFAFIDWPAAGPFRAAAFFLTLVALCGVAGNLRSLRNTSSWILQANRWRYGLAGGVAFWAAAAWLSTQFSWLEAPTQPQWVPAFLCAIALVAGGFLLIPAAVKLSGEDRLDYGQGWTQIMTVLPLFLSASMAGSVMYDYAAQPQFLNASYTTLLTQAIRAWAFPMSFVFACFLMLSICSVDLTSWKGYGVAILVAPLSTATLYALLCAVQLLLVHLRSFDGGRFHAFILAPSLILFSFSLSAVLMIGLLGIRAMEQHREWWSRLAAWMAIYSAGWLAVSLAAFYGPWLAGKFTGFSAHWPAIGAWVATTAAGLFAGNSSSTSGSKSDSARQKILEAIAHIAPFVFIGGIVLLISTIVHVLLLELAGTASGPYLTGSAYWTNFVSLDFSSTLTLALIAGALLALFAWRIDINDFSLNAFYRSRLVRCYLGASRAERDPQNFTGFDPGDDLRLERLAPTQYSGPFHIVNCALNLGGASDLDIQTRQCANFTLTSLYCGSRRDRNEKHEEHVGYFPTSEYLNRGGGLTLGQAISVSGAAASPNMGSHTSPIVAFLLTVFNVRLGWWFPNPAGTASDTTSPNFSFRYLVKELFGSAGEDSNFLMISDGGHFENLAVYELIRRKCSVIIAGDAEADPDLTFGSLGALIRLCEVDFGAEISIDVSSIRPDSATGFSRSHCAVGAIRYEDGSTGALIYLKSSLTGDEDTATRQYKSSHASFPHQSTADQFFSEDQFESYRRLGRHIAAHAFEHVVVESGKLTPETLDSLAAVWTPQLASGAAFTSLAGRLSSLWSRLSSDRDLGFLDQELFPSAGAAPFSASPEARRDAFYFCCELLQLMENVHLELNLQDTYHHPDQQGWMQLFRQWAQSPTLYDTFQKTKDTYGLRFQHFFESRLRGEAARGATAS